MIKIEVITKDPFYNLKDLNCISLGKRARQINKDQFLLKNNEEYRFEYYKRQFIAKHSTIDNLFIKIVDDNCRGDVIGHIVRSTRKQPRFVVQSKRPDWNNGEERKAPDKEYKLFASVWSVSSFMEMARQRLCGRAAEETRKWVIECMRVMDSSKDPLLMALSLCSVPNCVFQGACPEIITPCGKDLGLSTAINYCSLSLRYHEYHQKYIRGENNADKSE